MSAADAGGPAFPVDNVVRKDEKGYLVGCEISSAGMTLRDYFAAKAMQAHVSAQWAQHYATKPNEDVNNHWDDKDIAMIAYDMADEMLEARK